MINRLRLWLIGLCCCIAIPAVAIGQAAPDQRGDYARAITFFHQIQAALRQNDPRQVAQFVHFPLRADINGHARIIRTRSEFVANYPAIFTVARRKAIVESRDSDVWWRDQGYSIEYGVIWFDSFMPPGKAFPDVNSSEFWTSGTFGIKTVNPAKAEAK
jgi:hypothetical protein